MLQHSQPAADTSERVCVSTKQFNCSPSQRSRKRDRSAWRHQSNMSRRKQSNPKAVLKSKWTEGFSYGGTCCAHCKTLATLQLMAVLMAAQNNL